ncbi:MAG: hypothetical protein CMM25_01100, partial [Rhodospirillaceae bacterium]|nr:hypothetical protein [Rhodospirillaceae bacterium]
VGEPFYVDWRTENAKNSAVTGIATSDANGDYLSGSGTLFFETGAAEKIIYITGIPMPAVDDGEADEFFHIRLYNVRSDDPLVIPHITGTNPYTVIITEEP